MQISTLNLCVNVADCQNAVTAMSKELAEALQMQRGPEILRAFRMGQRMFTLFRSDDMSLKVYRQLRDSTWLEDATDIFEAFTLGWQDAKDNMYYAFDLYPKFVQDVIMISVHGELVAFEKTFFNDETDNKSKASIRDHD